MLQNKQYDPIVVKKETLYVCKKNPKTPQNTSEL